MCLDVGSRLSYSTLTEASWDSCPYCTTKLPQLNFAFLPHLVCSFAMNCPHTRVQLRWCSHVGFIVCAWRAADLGQNLLFFFSFFFRIFFAPVTPAFSLGVQDLMGKEVKEGGLGANSNLKKRETLGRTSGSGSAGSGKVTATSHSQHKNPAAPLRWA